MNPNIRVRTPYNQMPILMVYRSVERKLYRDQYCLECGHPFMAISDKFYSVQDGGVAIDHLRTGDKVVEARCKSHNCKQYYRLWV